MLNELFEKHGADKCMRLHGYAKLYEQLMAPLMDEPVSLLEIGVQHGCSIRAWLDYFGHPDTRIVGIDLAQQASIPDLRFSMLIGKQEDLGTWMKLGDFAFNFIIDDGSHQVAHQVASFNFGWPLVKPGGYYIIEDVHPWFDAKHGPIYHDGAKDLLWRLAAILNWNGKSYYGRPFPNETPNDYEKSFDSVTLSRGCIIIKKV
jgi:hypothetical protein